MNKVGIKSIRELWFRADLDKAHGHPPSHFSLLLDGRNSSALVIFQRNVVAVVERDLECARWLGMVIAI